MSLSRELIVAAKARADAATEGPWEAYVVPDERRKAGYVAVATGDREVQVARYEGGFFDAEFIAAARADVPVMADALLRVLDLHRRAHAVFSWNSGTKYEDPCPHCDGKAGVHDCGCWADSDIEYVCAECHRLGSRSSGVYDYAWPCATVRAVTGEDRNHD